MFAYKGFIRKNTPAIREKLKDLGYSFRSYYEDPNLPYIKTCDFNIAAQVPESFLRHVNKYEDCGTNEGLFFALVAYDDRFDNEQWFVKDKKWFLCHDFINRIGGHKATFEEIQKHFNPNYVLKKKHNIKQNHLPAIQQEFSHYIEDDPYSEYNDIDDICLGADPMALF